MLRKSITVDKWEQLPAMMDMRPQVLGRKLASPNTFNSTEAIMLAKVLNVSVSHLVVNYGVGIDDMTAGDILNILIQDKWLEPYAAAAAPSEALTAKDGGSTVTADR
jgi:hypothetical protein